MHCKCIFVDEYKDSIYLNPYIYKQKILDSGYFSFIGSRSSNAKLPPVPPVGSVPEGPVSNMRYLSC
jgi:hypothetical protein